MTNSQKPKVGDTIFIEQAWEDEAGYYHDEYAKVEEVSEGGFLLLKFRTKKLTNFLESANYHVDDGYKIENHD